MHDSSGLLDVQHGRPTDKKYASYTRRLPPVSHERLQWRHICTMATKRQVWQARISRVLAVNLLVASFAVFGIWMTAAFSPILAVGLVWGAVIDSFIPSAIAVAVWIVGLLYTQRETLIIVMRAGTGDSAGNKLEIAALKEEIWFREGAEHWSRWQRLKSSLLFGYAHQNRLLFTVWPVMILHAMGGMQYMREYLRAYRRTGSRQAALYEAATLHYRFNLATTEPVTVLMAIAGAAIVVVVALLVW